MEDDHKDVEAPVIDSKDWPRTIDAIEEWLRGYLGVSKILLAYVVRDLTTVGLEPAGGWSSKLEELIIRTLIINPDNPDIFNATYLSDRAKVWEKISHLIREHECWSYVRPAQQTHDGRMAFLGLKGHYLGANNIDNMSSLVEKLLR